MLKRLGGFCSVIIGVGILWIVSFLVNLNWASLFSLQIIVCVKKFVSYTRRLKKFDIVIGFRLLMSLFNLIIVGIL